MGALKHRPSSQALFGAVLLGIGILLLLHNTDVVHLGSIWTYWPFILVAFGVNKLIAPQHHKEIREGAWLVFLGLWLYVSFQHVFGLSFAETWPLVIVAWGVGVIWKSLDRYTLTVARENNHAA
jgi:hypothetical protein